MSRTTLDILSLNRTAGDDSLGRTLLRLAGLAETLHRHGGVQDTTQHDDPIAVQGWTDRLDAGYDAGAVHTEVDR